MTFASINGQTLVGVRLHVPNAGPWFADCELAEDHDVSGQVTLAIGSLSLSGTIDARYSGTFALQRRVRIVAGGGGWGSLLRARDYHSDAGITALSLAQDVAREAGEQLGSTFDPTDSRVGIDFVRASGPASRSLEQIIGRASWWVDFDGRTQVGSRVPASPSANDYEVLTFDPVSRLVTLSLRDDDLSLVDIGSVLTERLDEAQTIRELEVEVGEALTVRAWTGGSSSSRSRLADAFGAAVSRATDDRLFGLYRYRVAQMSGERVELRAVSSDAGLPDILPISMWPGMAGQHAELTPNALVLVQFIEGRPTMPAIVHFSGKDAAGWAPSTMTLDATSTIKVGAHATKAPAWVDSLQTELNAIERAFSTFVPGSSGASFPNPYVAPTDSSSLGATKTKVE